MAKPKRKARAVRAGDRITRRVTVDLDGVINVGGLNPFLDLIAELAGDPRLGDLTYRVVGVDHRGAHSGGGSDIVIEVSGEASAFYRAPGAGKGGA